MSFVKWLEEHARPRWLTSEGPKPGIYHYQRQHGEWNTRFHLRVDPDGGGLLLANAAEAAYLSPVGVEMAQQILKERMDVEVLAAVHQRFHSAAPGQMQADLDALRHILDDLALPGDNYPITNLQDPRTGERGRKLLAPFRADVVQGDPETMRALLVRLWEAGIPHVTFLAQPKARAQDLPLLVKAASDTEMITGVRAVASWLSPPLIREMREAGLDHLDLLYVSADAALPASLPAAGAHEAVRAALEQCRELGLCPLAEVPLFAGNVTRLRATLESLPALGVTNLSFFALACPEDDQASREAGALPAHSIPQVALTITEASEEAGARYLWAPPVRFDGKRTLAEQVQAGPRAAGDIAIRVEADGSVYPARGRRDCTGNLLTTAWEEIWSHDCFARYRGRLEQPQRCPECPDLPLCQADCPQDPEAWSDDSQGGEA